MNRDYNFRKAARFKKGIKRLKEDRAEHGSDTSCQCFCSDAGRGKGKIFARFADYPKHCGCFMCNQKKWDKGNSWRDFGAKPKYKPTKWDEE